MFSYFRLPSALMVLTLALPAGAATIFEDNFDSENFGTSQMGSGVLTNWDITSGQTDIIGFGFFDVFPNGDGKYLDMAGSTNGTIETVVVLTLVPGSYELSFDIGLVNGFSGNTLNFSIGNLLIDSVSPGTDTYTNITRNFLVSSTTSENIIFSEVGVDDVSGTILDNILLTGPAPVPLPASLWLFVSGLFGLFGLVKVNRLGYSL